MPLVLPLAPSAADEPPSVLFQLTCATAGRPADSAGPSAVLVSRSLLKLMPMLSATASDPESRHMTNKKLRTRPADVFMGERMRDGVSWGVGIHGLHGRS